MPSFKIVFVRLLKLTALAAAGVVVLAVLLGTFYAGEMKQLIVGELNKTLKSPVQVSDIDFSLLRHFPYASIELKDVKAMDAPAQGPQQVLLEAEKVSFLFHVMGLFRKDVSVRKAVVKNGRLFVRIDQAGNDNFHIWKAGSDTAQEPVIDLHRIVLDRVDITYDDLYAIQHYVMKARGAELRGRFTAEGFDLDINSSLFVEQLRIEGIDYLRQSEVKVQTHLSVNDAQGLYRFGKSRLDIDGAVFDVAGEVVDDNQHRGLYTDLTVDCHRADVEALLRLLPDEYRRHFRRYDSGGRLDMHLALQGGGSRHPQRSVSVQFAVKNGRLAPKGERVALSSMTLEGTYRSRPGREGELDIPKLAASLNGQPVQASLRLTGLRNPYLRLTASGSFAMNDLRPFLGADTIASLGGRLKADISFSGRLRDMERSRGLPDDVRASGAIRLENVSMRLKNNPLDFHDINGSMVLRDRNLQVTGLTGQISGTDFAIDGTLRNLVDYLFIAGSHASFDGRLASSMLNLDELMADKHGGSGSAYQLRFNPRLACAVSVSVSNLKFRRFRATDINGTLRLQDEVLRSSDLSFRSMGGTAHMDAAVDASPGDKIRTTCQATVAGIDIRELFYQMENFGQETMTDKNLRGRLAAGVTFSADWSNALDIRPATAKANCTVQIDNGELVAFGPVQALSKYLKVADLGNIRFSTLKNEIEISDRLIHIPAMEIRSSALNLTASGVHDFDNNVDYKLKMLLSDVLGKKVKLQHSEFGDIEDDGLGHAQLYLTMKGPADDPKFSYDRKSVGDKFRNDLQADKKNIRLMLKEEFGFFKKDTTVTQPQKKKKEELQVDWGESN